MGDFYGHVFLSHTGTTNLAPSLRENSAKGNDSELSDKNWRSKEWCVSSARADWLIAVCLSSLGDTSIPGRSSALGGKPPTRGKLEQKKKRAEETDTLWY